MFIVVVIIGGPHALKIGKQIGVRFKADAPVLPIGHSRRETTLPPLQNLLHQRRKDLFALSDHHTVNPGKRSEVL